MAMKMAVAQAAESGASSAPNEPVDKPAPKQTDSENPGPPDPDQIFSTTTTLSTPGFASGAGTCFSVSVA